LTSSGRLPVVPHQRFTVADLGTEHFQAFPHEGG